jgi:hypothetical protein
MNLLLIILIIIILVTYINGCNESFVDDYNENFIDIDDASKLNVYQLNDIVEAVDKSIDDSDKQKKLEKIHKIPNNIIIKFSVDQLVILLPKLSSTQKSAITADQKKKLSSDELKLLN